MSLLRDQSVIQRSLKRIHQKWDLFNVFLPKSFWSDKNPWIFWYRGWASDNGCTIWRRLGLFFIVEHDMDLANNYCDTIRHIFWILLGHLNFWNILIYIYIYFFFFQKIFLLGIPHVDGFFLSFTAAASWGLSLRGPRVVGGRVSTTGAGSVSPRSWTEKGEFWMFFGPKSFHVFWMSKRCHIHFSRLLDVFWTPQKLFLRPKWTRWKLKDWTSGIAPGDERKGSSQGEPVVPVRGFRNFCCDLMVKLGWSPNLIYGKSVNHMSRCKVTSFCVAEW